MKSYTDLEQSKVLSEILSHESADMGYNGIENRDTRKIGYAKIRYSNVATTMPNMDSIPCWSLSALIGVLPRIDIEKEVCSDGTYDYRVKAYVGDGYVGEWHDNPIDACYEMIIKLHELNLL